MIPSVGHSGKGRSVETVKRSTESDPHVHCGLWVMRTCPCGFIHCDKCLIQWGEADHGGGCAWVWTEGTWEISALNFAVNLKTLLKNTMYFKGKQVNKRGER